ncbi:uncharacterized protein [Clytia hemisphaerica]|uniref:uncharacterized protein n=1 Tax=Clytia hemisphaerica TaxID=252671 RepID=UPI0034D5F0B2
MASIKFLVFLTFLVLATSKDYADAAIQSDSLTCDQVFKLCWTQAKIGTDKVLCQIQDSKCKVKCYYKCGLEHDSCHGSTFLCFAKYHNCTSKCGKINGILS